MKERPILFTGDMVRAILEGRKTQTRRLIKGGMVGRQMCGNQKRWPWVIVKGTYHPVPCPYGQPGDRLWVRETSAMHPRFDTMLYRADGEWFQDAPGYGKWKPTWKPSIHMPRLASRITLEITDVRVERLREISYEDAVDEGILHEYPKAIAQFRELWERVYGADSWMANPWVWAVSFKVVGK